MLSFLDDTGVISWFDSIESLRELVVLDPQFLANLFATLVSFSRSWKNGVITSLDIQQAWKHYPPHLHTSFIELMEQYEVIFPYTPRTLGSARSYDFLLNYNT